MRINWLCSVLVCNVFLFLAGCSEHPRRSSDSTRRESYFDTGEIFKIETLKKGVLNGQYIEFYKNGVVSVSGHFSNGFKSGIWLGWWESGAVRYMSDYDMERHNDEDNVVDKYAIQIGLKSSVRRNPAQEDVDRKNIKTVWLKDEKRGNKGGTPP